MTKNNSEHSVRIPAERLRQFVAQVLTTAGVGANDSQIVADVLTAADLRGVESHGVALLGWYLAQIQMGAISLSSSASVVREGGAVALIDANNTLGAPVSVRAMDMCLDLAEEFGISAVSVRNSNHFGMAAYYALRALSRDMIGLAMTNASRLIAPTFGTEPMLGTNPLAVAVPAGASLPYVLDMATSVRPFGKIATAQQAGAQLPTGVAIDAQGQPIHSPEYFIKAVRTTFEAALLPLGSEAELSSYKGYGLAMLVDILSGVLSGANFSKDVGSDPAAPAGVGHWFLAINVSNFMPLDQFRARMDALANDLTASRKAPGASRIYIPGEIEFETEMQRNREGIPIDVAGLQSLHQIAERTGVALELSSRPGAL